MLAASYWSLLSPAIEMAEESRLYGSFTFVPVSVGFLLGAGFVYAADIALPYLVRGGAVCCTALEVCCILGHRSCNTFSVGYQVPILVRSLVFSGVISVVVAAPVLV